MYVPNSFMLNIVCHLFVPWNEVYQWLSLDKRTSQGPSTKYTTLATVFGHIPIGKLEGGPDCVNKKERDCLDLLKNMSGDDTFLRELRQYYYTRFLASRRSLTYVKSTAYLDFCRR